MRYPLRDGPSPNFVVLEPPPAMTKPASAVRGIQASDRTPSGLAASGCAAASERARDRTAVPTRMEVIAFFMSWLLRMIGPVVAKSAARDYVRCLKGALRSYAKGTTPGGQLSSPAITRTLASSACTLFGLAGVVSTRLHVLSQVSPRLPWRAGPMSELAGTCRIDPLAPPACDIYVEQLPQWGPTRPRARESLHITAAST